MCFCFRSQAARGNEGKDGLSEMGTRLDPVPGLPGGEFLLFLVGDLLQKVQYKQMLTNFDKTMSTHRKCDAILTCSLFGL